MGRTQELEALREWVVDERCRLIAVLGMGKTVESDYLSSEDVELLETLSGYIGIAIQNARLYASLQQRIAAYERLKEFNENIVESISVGVLAVDLADRVESWNSQMEVMYAKPRAQALGRPLSEIFPPAFVEEYYRVRQSPGIHNFYKFRLSTPTGESRVANIAIAPLVTRQFEVVGRIIIVDDITDRLELESQLGEVQWRWHRPVRHDEMTLAVNDLLLSADAVDLVIDSVAVAL